MNLNAKFPVKNSHKLLAGLAFSIVSSFIALPSFAQQTATPAAAAAPQPWIYKTKQLDRAQIDALHGKSKKVLVIDVRRPDEVISKGGFPVYLSVQIKELEQSLDLIPKDRSIITVSNRAHRAGEAGDLLTSKGFTVAGAAGSLDYEEQGGKVVRITPPVPKTPASGGAATTVKTPAK